jgi:urease accessory protein
MNRTRAVIAFGLVGLLASLGAEAHIVTMRLGDFFMGALHPMTDPIDWLLWLGVALLGARADCTPARWLIVTVPVGLVLGLWLAVVTTHLLPAVVTDALPLVAVGLLLASALRLGHVTLLAVAAGLMLLRGMANAAGLRVGADLGLYAAGLAGAGYVAITLLAALVLKGAADDAAPAWRRIAVRVLGSWLAAAGLMLLALGLRA